MAEIIFEVLGRSIIVIFQLMTWGAGELIIEVIYSLWPKNKEGKVKAVIFFFWLFVLGAILTAIINLFIVSASLFAMALFCFALSLYLTAPARHEIRHRRKEQRAVKRAQRNPGI